MKLLRNKSIVVILAVMAVGIVTRNIILPLFHSALPLAHIENNGKIPGQKEEPFQQIVSIESGSDTIANFDALDWADDYLRDPFIALTMADSGPVSVEKTDTSVALGRGKLPQQDILIAVVHESGKALAVINDVIVGVGDYYDEYKIITIGLDSVKLEGPDGYKTLEF